MDDCGSCFKPAQSHFDIIGGVGGWIWLFFQHCNEHRIDKKLLIKYHPGSSSTSAASSWEIVAQSYHASF